MLFSRAVLFPPFSVLTRVAAFVFRRSDHLFASINVLYFSFFCGSEVHELSLAALRFLGVGALVLNLLAPPLNWMPLSPSVV